MMTKNIRRHWRTNAEVLRYVLNDRIFVAQYHCQRHVARACLRCIHDNRMFHSIVWLLCAISIT